MRTRTSQETPSVGVADHSDYLRIGNVKPDDQSLGLPDQETPQIALFPNSLLLPVDIFIHVQIPSKSKLNLI
jgi:hypothetical protein